MVEHIDGVIIISVYEQDCEEKNKYLDFRNKIQVKFQRLKYLTNGAMASRYFG